MAIYRIVIQVLALEDRSAIKEESKNIDIDPEEFEVETTEGLEAVVRAEAGHVAAHLFRKVKKALY